MIHHLVLFKLVPGTTEAQVRAAGDALLEMRGRIPEIRDIHFGPNLAPSAAEWPWALVVVCDDMDAVNRYLVHPVHVETVNVHVAPVRQERLAIDVELP